MRYDQLNENDQKLLNMDFGEDLEKEAAAEAGVINEMYYQGFDKIATQIADEFDEMAKEAAAGEEDDGYNEEFEKRAADLGAFIERGMFDGLQKLGSERHGDANYYLVPYIEEKVANAGAKAALKKLTDWGKSAKNYAKRSGSEAKKAVTGKGPKGGKTPKRREYAKRTAQRAGALGGGLALGGAGVAAASGGDDD